MRTVLITIVISCTGFAVLFSQGINYKEYRLKKYLKKKFDEEIMAEAKISPIESVDLANPELVESIKSESTVYNPKKLLKRDWLVTMSPCNPRSGSCG